MVHTARQSYVERNRCTQNQVHTKSGAHETRYTQYQVHTTSSAHKTKCTHSQVLHPADERAHRHAHTQTHTGFGWSKVPCVYFRVYTELNAHSVRGTERWLMVR